MDEKKKIAIVTVAVALAPYWSSDLSAVTVCEFLPMRTEALLSSTLVEDFIPDLSEEEDDILYAADEYLDEPSVVAEPTSVIRGVKTRIAGISKGSVAISEELLEELGF